MNKTAPLNTEQLTFTRFIAAISIVVYHFGDIYPPFNNILLAPIVKNANLGVSYFFVLSGVVMVLAYHRFNKISFTQYLVKRAARILPLYYFALMAMLVYYFIRIYILHQPSIYTPHWIDVGLNLTLLQSWVPMKATTVNTAAWSLSVEFLFYLSFPVLFRWFKNKSNKARLFITMTIFGLSQLIYHLALQTSFAGTAIYHPLLHFNSFLIGVFTGFLIVKPSSKPLQKNNLFIIATLAVITFLMAKQIPGLSYHNGLLSPFFALLIYLLSLNTTIVSRIFQQPFFKMLGEISYGIYILQFPVFLFFTATLTFFCYKIDSTLFYLYVLLLICISYFSYLWIEQPLRKKIRGFAIKVENV